MYIHRKLLRNQSRMSQRKERDAENSHPDLLVYDSAIWNDTEYYRGASEFAIHVVGISPRSWPKSVRRGLECAQALFVLKLDMANGFSEFLQRVTETMLESISQQWGTSNSSSKLLNNNIRSCDSCEYWITLDTYGRIYSYLWGSPLSLSRWKFLQKVLGVRTFHRRRFGIVSENAVR